jgi:drug/metabolite transporter (DMT)-like permease
MTSSIAAPRRADARTILAGAGWSTIFGLSFLMTKGALDAFRPLALLFLRFVLATAALGALALVGIARLDYRGKPKLPLALVCLFQPILYFALETYGLRETASSTAGLILGALPAAVAALSAVALKERLSARQAIGLAASVAGVAAVALAGGGASASADNPRGVALVVGALASAAVYNVLSRRARSLYTPVELTFAMMASGAAAFGLLSAIEAVAAGEGFLPAKAPGEAWLAVAYLGLLSSVLAFFLVNLSLSRLKASQAAVFGGLTPCVALAAGVVFRGEAAGLLEIGGAAAIVAGIWATNARERIAASEPSMESTE